MQFSILPLAFLVVAASALPTPAAAAATYAHNCDLSNIELPIAPTPLPSPTGTLQHILIGRGFQNYTCDLSNATAVPVSIGALALLIDASCAYAVSPYLAALQSSMLYSVRRNALPSLSSDPGFNQKFIAPANTAAQTIFEQQMASFVTGHHFFTDATTPRFDLDTTNGLNGAVTVAKSSASDAPADAQVGSVPWLYLTAAPGCNTTQSYTEVYRVETMGGAAPATCKEAGTANMQIKYSAQYWFYK